MHRSLVAQRFPAVQVIEKFERWNWRQCKNMSQNVKCLIILVVVGSFPARFLRNTRQLQPGNSTGAILLSGTSSTSSPVESSQLEIVHFSAAWHMPELIISISLSISSTQSGYTRSTSCKSCKSRGIILWLNCGQQIWWNASADQPPVSRASDLAAFSVARQLCTCDLANGKSTMYRWCSHSNFHW